MARHAPFFVKSHGRPRVDDKPVFRGIVFINCNGSRWRDTPEEYRTNKTLNSRWKRRCKKGISARMLAELVAGHGERKTTIPCRAMDATYLIAHGTETSMAEKGGRGRLIGRTKGGINTKLMTACDGQGRPLNLFVTPGSDSDYIDARALLSSIPNVDWLLGERGRDTS